MAAPTVVGERSSSGFVLIHTAGSRLKAKTQASAELRRTAYARHRFDFDAFDIDVLVLDAAEFRRRGLLQSAVPLIEEFGLTLRELLHFESGPHHAVVPLAWHGGTAGRRAAALLIETDLPVAEDLAPGQGFWFSAPS